MQSLNLRQRPTWFFLRLFAVFLLLFLLLRLAFLWVYPHEFADLSLGQTLYAMLKGAWFMDASITMIFLGIPFLLAYLPLQWLVSQWYLKLVSWYAFVVLFSFIMMGIGDLLYFGMVHRHTGQELAAALDTSMGSMLDMVLSAYWIYFMAFAVVMAVSARLWHRYMMPPTDIQHIRMGWMRIPFFVSMFLIILLTMRGGIESKPIKTVFAYNEGSMAQGHLTLNGVFATLHSLNASKMRVPDFMPEQDAEAIVQTIYHSKYETYPNPDYPLMRERSSIYPEQGKLNVVVLLLESWDPDFIDITRELAGKESYGVTPHYNALAKKGRLYTNFYANGQRSIDGIAAVIAGIPRVPGAGGIGEGIEVNGVGWLGDIAKQQGYATSFLSGSYRHSFYMDKVSALAGFDTYYGSEDLTSLHPNPPKSHWGGWDYDLFMKGHELYAKTKQPFLSVMFSVSTHTPWALPEPRFKKFDGDSDAERFLNTMYYTDWALGKFFDGVAKSDYAKNTIFILLADHASGNMPHPDMRAQYRIPLLILAPNLEAGLDDRLSSQIDLIPTIIDLAGWKKSRYASLGISIVDDSVKPSVIFGRDAMTGRIEENEALVVRSLDRLTYSEGEPKQIQAAETRLKAQVQVLLNAWQHNSLMQVNDE
ncbi:MAG: LTA synthase family protein [Ghiorsea sp.]|nr:LTA synthase family protein [Ghiorsea sp.]